MAVESSAWSETSGGSATGHPINCNQEDKGQRSSKQHVRRSLQNFAGINVGHRSLLIHSQYVITLSINHFQMSRFSLLYDTKQTISLRLIDIWFGHNVLLRVDC